MNWLHAVILGIVEGITEFLPISSTGHLNIVEKLFGYEISSEGMTAFTAVIQVGAILAAIIYFWKDIVRIVVPGQQGSQAGPRRHAGLGCDPRFDPGGRGRAAAQRLHRGPGSLHVGHRRGAHPLERGHVAG